MTEPSQHEPAGRAQLASTTHTRGPMIPGAYVGNRPERQAETIPGGVGDDDERIAAHSTQRAPGHDDSADPPDLREAGENH